MPDMTDHKDWSAFADKVLDQVIGPDPEPATVVIERNTLVISKLPEQADPFEFFTEIWLGSSRLNIPALLKL